MQTRTLRSKEGTGAARGRSFQSSRFLIPPLPHMHLCWSYSLTSILLLNSEVFHFTLTTHPSNYQLSIPSCPLLTPVSSVLPPSKPFALLTALVSLYLTPIFNHSPKSWQFYLEISLKHIYSLLLLLSICHMSSFRLDNSICLTGISDFIVSLLPFTSTGFSPCHQNGLFKHESYQEMPLFINLSWLLCYC